MSLIGDRAIAVNLSEGAVRMGGEEGMHGTLTARVEYRGEQDGESVVAGFARRSQSALFAIATGTLPRKMHPGMSPQMRPPLALREREPIYLRRADRSLVLG